MLVLNITGICTNTNKTQIWYSEFIYYAFKTRILNLEFANPNLNQKYLLFSTRFYETSKEKYCVVIYFIKRKL